MIILEAYIIRNIEKPIVGIIGLYSKWYLVKAHLNFCFLREIIAKPALLQHGSPKRGRIQSKFSIVIYTFITSSGIKAKHVIPKIPTSFSLAFFPGRKIVIKAEGSSKADF